MIAQLRFPSWKDLQQTIPTFTVLNRYITCAYYLSTTKSPLMQSKGSIVLYSGPSVGACSCHLTTASKLNRTIRESELYIIARLITTPSDILWQN